VKRILRKARDGMTPVDPELDAEPRSVNPKSTLPGAVGPPPDGERTPDDGRGYTFWMRDGVTPYRSKGHDQEVFSRDDDGWMGTVVDPASLWSSTANEVAGEIGGQARLAEPRKGWMPYDPGPEDFADDDLEEADSSAEQPLDGGDANPPNDPNEPDDEPVG
jgi:hypothetical protein